ncbi:RagB/SusD family nutrient uptake outer membrane protein [Flavihumibacter rivuli]|uniref:RagB/SusD family nutrient uptake outer membrane protein n=1 Tax=Flavihumibacter rivuli TaxID=2838156 RepID=UPI001BDEA05A|nr:RagB/SusD family nutrient uptake outer membrane protein [Flavihumibacter rivuli]ULQ55102.1 RagB/SusD family nutrient uptake outer membrane protein [Flavihumibacter rivuli]
MKKTNIAILVAAMLGLGSCTKVLEQEPQGALDATTAFTTRTGVEAGLRGTYDILQSGNYYGLRYQALTDMSADNIIHTGTFPSFAQIFTRQILADNAETTNMWNTIYNGINRANNIIVSAETIEDPAFNKAQAIGEARFLRALMYFDLLRVFGGSPDGYGKANGQGLPLYLVPTLTPADAAPKAKATESEVWAAIKADLDAAIASLPASNSIGRASLPAANALKARVHLYLGEWDAAETAATAVLTGLGVSASATGGLAADYSSLWLSKNVKPESILELPFYPDDANSIAFFYYPGSLGGRNEITSSTSLRDAHPDGDLRKGVNYTVAAPGIPANKTRKASRISGDDNVIVIRLAELWLIRAEARARKATPDLENALKDLNIVRKRAGLADFTATTVDAFLTQLEIERRLEFAHEGHRWFDLRRWNKLGLTEAFRALWPIPLREVQTSGGIIAQNPGY